MKIKKIFAVLLSLCFLGGMNNISFADDSVDISNVNADVSLKISNTPLDSTLDTYTVNVAAYVKFNNKTEPEMVGQV